VILVLRKLLAGGLSAALTVVAAPSASAAVTFTLPEPTGNGQVGTTSLHLVDANRKDPWKPDRQRELMVSVWYPARNADQYPRAPWATRGITPWLEGFGASLGIPQGSVDWNGVKTDGHVGAPAKGRWPVVVYSPGFGAPRLAATLQAEDLASHGYIVVTIDHTYETMVEFPGGRVEPPVTQDGSPDSMKKAIDARVADTRFVLDKLGDIDHGRNPDAEGHPLPRGLAMDLPHIGMFGHSYGGFAAGETMYYDKRIDAGINLDGAMSTSSHPYQPGEVVKHGLDRPFQLMGSQGADDNGKPFDHTHTDPFDPSWGDFWANQRGWKRDILLHGSGHYSYTDLQMILPQLAGPLNIPPTQWAPLIGTTDPAGSLQTQNTEIRCFFTKFLR
jgi:platelet-activating factor acetylhydrolase isoform II